MPRPVRRLRRLQIRRTPWRHAMHNNQPQPQILHACVDDLRSRPYAHERERASDRILESSAGESLASKVKRMRVLSEKTWVGVGLGLRLLMAGALAASVQLKYANHGDGFYELQSYTYAVVTAGVGALGFVLQALVAVYLLCRMCRQRAPGVGALNLSMYADMVASAVLASGVGAGFGATNDARQMADGRWAYWEQGGEKRDLDGYYDRGAFAVIFLLAGMLLSMGASVVSARLRVWAAEGHLP